MTFDNYLYNNPAYAPRPFTYVEPEAISEFKVEDHASLALQILNIANEGAPADRKVRFAVITDINDNIKHVGVILINDNIVDIEGVMEPTEWEQKWFERLDKAGVENDSVIWNYDPESVKELAYNSYPDKTFGKNQFLLEDFVMDMEGEIF